MSAPGPVDAAGIEALLADPQRRPPGGWSARAEAWAHDRDTASWRDVETSRRLRRDLAQERQKVADLAAELHARGGEAPRW